MPIRVRITLPEGRILDDIAPTHGTPSSFAFAASGQRWRVDAQVLGDMTADYLEARVHE